jgi:hypothetical protein
MLTYTDIIRAVIKREQQLLFEWEFHKAEGSVESAVLLKS